ncbi:transcriptional repressor LexA [Bacillus infantis]|uniref:transcriptional repressor LexA n=1 Tax=Bacillus infantis TaxID=324767 RepID=UPI002004E67F|nr:transcriptional repressor LexA [Bacillus infantis]MCK6203977.1 transcriptional repressor LexA [Bacillus infantis]
MDSEINFGDQLMKWRKEKKLSIRKLADLSGVSHTYLSQVETGKRGVPSPDILEKLAKPLDIDYQQLMKKANYIKEDEEEYLVEEYKDAEKIANESLIAMMRLYPQYISEEKFLGYLNKHEDQREVETLIRIRNAIANNEPSFLDDLSLLDKVRMIKFMSKYTYEDFINNNEVHIPEVLTVPLLGHISAGKPLLASDHIEDYIEIPNMWNLHTKDVFTLRVKGDSMINSRIHDGDIVVVKNQQDVENGDIAVVNVNGDDATLKKVKKFENGQTWLYPSNDKYEPILIDNENARIIGKVIQVMFEPGKV